MDLLPPRGALQETPAVMKWRRLTALLQLSLSGPARYQMRGYEYVIEFGKRTLPRSRKRQKKRPSEPVFRQGKKQTLIARQFKMAVEAEHRDNMQAAMQHYMQIVKLDPHQAEAHNRLGVCTAKQEQYVAAVRHFSEAVRLAPDNGPMRRNLGVALYRDHEFEDAVVHLQKALELGEKSFETRYHLAASHYSRGDPDTLNLLVS